MKFIFKMEKVLITLTGILCAVLILKLLYSLRTILPWRVNCWFCNCNFWVKFFERNSWTCLKCDQYNGFTKDGDYNKQLFTPNEPSRKTPKLFPSSPPSNGLCKMCNINQQLKVAQLANFVPMNDKKFDEEIESYRMQLEKAYRLCSPCKKVLQMKLHKEKEVLLGTKQLESRTPDKKALTHELRNQKLSYFIHSTSMYLAGVIFILVSIECYANVMKNKSLLTSLSNTKDVFLGLLQRIFSILKMKILMTFPILENYLIDVRKVLHLDNWPTYLDLLNINDILGNYNILTQEALLGFAVLIQAMGYIWSKNKVKSSFTTDFLWATFGISCIIQHLLGLHPTAMSFGKLSSLLTVMYAHKKMKTNSKRRSSTSPKIKKNLSNHTMNSLIDEQDLSMETDDDVSLSQFGLHNFSDSSNDTINPLNNSLINGRSFTPRSNGSVWTNPKLNSTLNSTFCVNPVLKSPSSVSETIFAKPIYEKSSSNASFHKYQNLSKDDSDSDLDESISALCIGSPKKSKKNGSVFSLRKFTATPNFVAPTPLTRSRPLISPSKLGHSTSWVAGGYWGAEGERLFNINGSRSSSQSSGFESQASSVNQRNNIMSQPSSREESVCEEPDRNPLLDRFQNCNMSNCSSFQGDHNQQGNFQAHSNVQTQTPQSFARVSSPVFPQMQYNSHVHIPQPRLARHCVPNVFAQPQFHQNNLFKAPSGSGLIRLPQTNPFASR